MLSSNKIFSNKELWLLRLVGAAGLILWIAIPRVSHLNGQSYASLNGTCHSEYGQIAQQLSTTVAANCHHISNVYHLALGFGVAGATFLAFSVIVGSVQGRGKEASR